MKMALRYLRKYRSLTYIHYSVNSTAGLYRRSRYQQISTQSTVYSSSGNIIMRMSKGFLFLLLVCLVFFPFTRLMAANLLPKGVTIKDSFAPGLGSPIGKILLVQGKAVVVHAKEKDGYRVEKDMPLFKGDTVVTMERSRLRYQLNDDSVVTMAATTRVVLSQSEFTREKGRATFLKLDGGKARFLVKKLLKAKRSEFKVKTPTALVGVRGSDFIIKASKTLTEVTTLKHTLLEVLSGAALDRAPTMLSDMQRTTIERGGLPSDVENITQEEMEALHDEFAMGREMRGDQPQDIRGGQKRGADDSSSADEGGGEDTGEAADDSAVAADTGGEDTGGPSEIQESSEADSGGGETTPAADIPDAGTEGAETGPKLEPAVNILVPVEVLEEPVPMSVEPVVDTTTPVEQDVFKQLDVQEQVKVEEIVTDTIQQEQNVAPTVLPDLPSHP
jgi:hypothetical protein